MKSIKIALVQLNIAWEAKSINHDRAEKFIKRAAEQQCTIVVFPEMFNTGCSINIPLIAEDTGGTTDLFLAAMAKKYNVTLIAGFPVKTTDSKKGENVAAVYDNHGALIAFFSKLHPFSYTHEDHYFAPGKNTVTFTVAGITASIFICYDLRFPEVFRKVARKVQAIFVIANWPEARIQHWEALLKARAIENQCFVIGVNRTGFDNNGNYYPGASQIFDPFGKHICSGGEQEEFIVSEIDPDETKRIRTTFPFLKDMNF